MDQVHVVWSDRNWRCELHSAANGLGRLKIFRGDSLMVLEPTPLDERAFTRAEFLKRGLLEMPQID